MDTVGDQALRSGKNAGSQLDACQEQIDEHANPRAAPSGIDRRAGGELGRMGLKHGHDQLYRKLVIEVTNAGAVVSLMKDGLISSFACI